MATSWRSLFTEQITDKFGYVNTLEKADCLINLFLSTTKSQFVLYKVDAKFFGNTAFNAKARKLNWEYDATKFHEAVPYDGTPFMRVNQKVLNCQFGKDKSGNKRKQIRAQKQLENEANEETRKTWSNFISKKRDCPANITLLEVIRFPDFTLLEDSKKGRQFVSQYLFNSLKKHDVKSERRIYVSLPKQEDHQFHPFPSQPSKFPIKSIVKTQHKMRAALVSPPGRVEDVSVKNIPVFMSAKKEEIIIDVYASAINREDTEKRSKLTSSEDPHILGCEAAGTVFATGGKDSKWSLGDRVMAYLLDGGCAEKVTVHQEHVMPVPQWMTLNSAAALPQAWLTAYHLLCHDASMNVGDIVLIHAGASSIGTALVQLVTMAGGCAIVTVGSQGKIDICKSLGASAGFCYKSLDCGNEIAKYLEGKSVNVIFDPVAGTHWQLNSNLIAKNGTWIIYGLLSGPYIAGDMRPLMTKNVTIKTSYLRSQSHEYIAELITSFTEKVLPYFQPNSEFELKPVINKFYKLEEISEAHKFLKSNQSVGKIVITIRDEIGTEVCVNVNTVNHVSADNDDGAGTSSQLLELKEASSQLLAEHKKMARKQKVSEDSQTVVIHLM